MIEWIKRLFDEGKLYEDEFLVLVTRMFQKMNQDGKCKNFRHLMEVFTRKSDSKLLLQVYFDMKKEYRWENLQYIPHEFFWKIKVNPNGYPELKGGRFSKRAKLRIWGDLGVPYMFRNWKLVWGESFCGNTH